tara:strand:- start:527 stop:769 length:243 start_codon:yes stop_codon:yes gene_type:complete
MDWHVYILRCGDDTLYTGIARDLEKRVAVHNSGKGAKYTARRLPVKLTYSEEAENRSAASKREYAIKQLSRAEKLALISS